MDSLYAYVSYKDAIKGIVTAKRSAGRAIAPTFMAMAEYCRVQKTYLSKVLNHDGHLNEDQLYLACEYLGLNEEEREFLLLLLAYERAQLPKRRRELESRIESVRVANLKTEKNLAVQTQSAVPGDLAEYYLDPYYQVIHMYLTLKRFQTQPMAIADSLGLKPPALERYLGGLERMGIIRLQTRKGRTQPEAQVLKDNLHLPESSFLHSAYAIRLRLKAMERMDMLEKKDAYRFSAVFSTTPRVRQKIHSSFIEWLKSVQQMVAQNREEEVYQLNFDLFNWS